ncbi:PREDICTED: beta-glucosidase 44-like [Camelina sativa]|uniref:Beta-glucosidase 44-like n=1 Tax=Camelina sativa TaxID=90675 RepID=A0ABM1RR66_CAMSA|nr:PREDICTED: beta-glucosidase 44-like [Camelina sativa]
MIVASHMFLFLFLLLSASRSGESSPSGDGVPMDTGDLNRESFPGGFLFGTATSAYQVEGETHQDGRGPSIWDAFVKIPGKIANNATAELTVDQYHRYKEDVDLMQNLNFDAYRFSISWSRIFPEGTGKINWNGVAYYNRLIDYLILKGIKPYANLYHYDLPLALEQKYQGLLSKQVVEDFADYAEFCFKTFGDRVKNWMTFNEPRVVAALGYDNGIFAPGRCSKAFGNCTDGNSATEPYIVAHHLILAHSAAVQRYRQIYQEKKKGRIGILLDFVWFEPLTSSEVDNDAAQRARDFHVGWAHSEWLYNVPWGMYKALMYIKEHYGNPTMILSENGMDDPGNITLAQGLNDTTRINYYRDYLAQLKKAVDEGANVTGYFAWSLLDNFEWLSGYTSRFGIVYVDYKDLKRYPKISALWFKQLQKRDQN